MSAASHENAPTVDTFNTADLEIGDPSPSGGESDSTPSPDSEVSLNGEEGWKPDHTAPEPGEEPQYLGRRVPHVYEAAQIQLGLVIALVLAEIRARAGVPPPRRGAGRSVVSAADILPRQASPGPQVPNGQ